MTDLDELRSLTTKQVSELTGIERKTLDSWRSRGIGPNWIKPVGVVLYPLSSLRDWLAEQPSSSSVLPSSHSSLLATMPSPHSATTWHAVPGGLQE